MRLLSSATAVAALTYALLIGGYDPAAAAPVTSLASSNPLAAQANGDRVFEGGTIEEIRYRKGGRHRFRGGYGSYRTYGRYRGYPRYRGYRGYRGYPRFGIDLYFAPYYLAPPPIYYAPTPYYAPYSRRGYGNGCSYWTIRCSANWSRSQDIRGCLRYYGCF